MKWVILVFLVIGGCGMLAQELTPSGCAGASELELRAVDPHGFPVTPYRVELIWERSGNSREVVELTPGRKVLCGSYVLRISWVKGVAQEIPLYLFGGHQEVVVVHRISAPESIRGRVVGNLNGWRDDGLCSVAIFRPLVQDRRSADSLEVLSFPVRKGRFFASGLSPGLYSILVLGNRGICTSGHIVVHSGSSESEVHFDVGLGR